MVNACEFKAYRYLAVIVQQQIITSVNGVIVNSKSQYSTSVIFYYNNQCSMYMGKWLIIYPLCQQLHWGWNLTSMMYQYLPSRYPLNKHSAHPFNQNSYLPTIMTPIPIPRYHHNTHYTHLTNIDTQLTNRYPPTDKHSSTQHST